MESDTAQKLDRADADQGARLKRLEHQTDDLPWRTIKKGGSGSASIDFVTADTWPDIEDMPQSGSAIKFGYTTEDRYFGVWVVNRWMCLSHFIQIDE